MVLSITTTDFLSTDPQGEYDGIARGINEKGELLVERGSDGQTVQVYAGEVSVRGVYGYAV